MLGLVASHCGTFPIPCHGGRLRDKQLSLAGNGNGNDDGARVHVRRRYLSVHARTCLHMHEHVSLLVFIILAILLSERYLTNAF